VNYQQLLKRSRNGVALFWDITDRSKQSLSLGLPGGALTSTVCPRGGCSNYIPNLRGGEPERNIRANGRPWKNSDICITHHVWYGLKFFHFTDRILLLLDWREQQHGFGLEDGSAA